MTDRPHPIHPETRAAIDDAVRVGLSNFARPIEPDPAADDARPQPTIDRGDYEAGMLRIGQVRDLVRCLSDAAGSSTVDGAALESCLFLASELLQECEHRLALVR